MFLLLYIIFYINAKKSDIYLQSDFDSKKWSKRKKNMPYICLKIISCSIQTEPYFNATKSVSIVNFNKMSSIDI